MKIGIMSMQRIINYGSYLIAHSMKNTFEKMGHQVEFVDFKIEPPLTTHDSDHHEDNLNENDKNFMAQQEQFLTRFKEEWIKSLGIDQRNERPELDLLVIGSDEVFNCLQANPDVGYSVELFGKDNNAKKVITYAASCGSTTYERLVSFGKDKEVADLLKKMDAISVRDNNTREFVEKLTNITPTMSLDPVLLYNFEDEIVDNVEDENYIIVYSYILRLNDEENQALINFARKHNKKIICVGMYQKCCDKFIPAAPLEMLGYFKKADYVFTDTFHGSIFSIKAQKPFATLIRESNKEKLTDLLERFDKSDRIIGGMEDLEKVLLAPIDYTNTNQIIEKMRIEAYDYLNQFLK